MDFSAVGKKIRELRKLMEMSQEDLAEGICTQAQISKIEKGDVYPFASTLYLISQKLGVDVNYFFDIGMTPRIDYVQEVANQLKFARRNSDYDTMKQIIHIEEKNPLFSHNNRNMQLLIWHKGIVEHAVNHDKAGALCLLEEAIYMTKANSKAWSEREIEILLSIGAIHFEEKEYEKTMDVCISAKEHLQLLPYVNDHTIFIRLYYNIARTFTRVKKYRESTNYCKEAIRNCIQKDNLYLLGELHYHIGYNYELLGKIAEAKNYMKKALTIFELQEDEKYMKFINDKLSKW